VTLPHSIPEPGAPGSELKPKARPLWKVSIGPSGACASQSSKSRSPCHHVAEFEVRDGLQAGQVRVVQARVDVVADLEVLELPVHQAAPVDLLDDRLLPFGRDALNDDRDAARVVAEWQAARVFRGAKVVVIDRLVHARVDVDRVRDRGRLDLDRVGERHVSVNERRIREHARLLRAEQRRRLGDLAAGPVVVGVRVIRVHPQVDWRGRLWQLRVALQDRFEPGRCRIQVRIDLPGGRDVTVGDADDRLLDPDPAALGVDLVQVAQDADTDLVTVA
jgi:hypothetical protein